ncbi:hypothetical protein PM082_003964 [Marasmius tenuissimus]|nr:hypothetical protein PM082_003964 [Marasmius tenuissimus]
MRVELVDGEGKFVRVNGMVDDGAMIVGLSTQIYNEVKGKIRGWGESRMWMRMADGALVPGVANWEGRVRVKGLEVQTSIEVFDSGGQWDLLLGKPLLESFKAVHDYGKGELVLKGGRESRKMFSEGLGKAVKPRERDKRLVAKIKEVVDEEEDIRLQRLDKAGNQGGVNVNTETPRSREVLIDLVFEEEKIPTHEKSQTDIEREEREKLLEEYREWRRKETTERQERILERKKWIEEWEDEEKKRTESERGRQWKGKREGGGGDGKTEELQWTEGCRG